MRVRFFGSLSSGGSKEIDISLGKSSIKLIDVMSFLQEKYRGVNLISNGKLRPDVIILINGKDYRLLGGTDTQLSDLDEISIIPINHGG
ncbi:MAG: MoaD/ThiS family protein [Sulfolobaceae archaeon]|jgi:Ubiquitin-like protein|nr:MoaD/ThiS family protein [Sulfolobales archaeon]MCQ4407237.1 MoaD/ThiS family protein [Sulfolobales archaeon]MCQ4447983.1 MoaD/ThiS family protein [Sulfolobales archaeon]MCQ4450422.1 MoaD/ThiS family protein [Sulfolobales archaeon]PVU73423.1 ubiquitin [Sulfolobales archaeon SCGC AB-777_J03]